MTFLQLLATVLAGGGTYLLCSSPTRSGVPAGTRRTRHTRPIRRWLGQAGLASVRPLEFIGVLIFFAVVAGSVSFVLFGSWTASGTASLCCGSAPLAMYRSRRDKLRESARQGWPRVLEDVRLQSGAVGRSLPVALFDAGTRAPTEPMRNAFHRAEREWTLTTDFSRALTILTAELDDPTADAVCETLLVAHELGSSDVGRRLADLIEDRRTDIRNRSEAHSRQAGARFARWFVLAVPLGMALVGLTIGDGRSAYQTSSGQLGVTAGIALSASCWIWAGRILRLPEEPNILRKTREGHYQ